MVHVAEDRNFLSQDTYPPSVAYGKRISVRDARRIADVRLCAPRPGTRQPCSRPWAHQGE